MDTHETEKDEITYDLIKDCRVSYMRIELNSTGEWIVVRPQLGSHKFPQKRFKREHIARAVEYLNQCLAGVSKLTVGGVPSGTKKIETLGYYIKQFIEYETELKRLTPGSLRSYRNWFNRFANASADGSLISAFGLNAKKMNEVKAKYFKSIGGSTSEKKLNSAIAIYHEFCSDHGLQPRELKPEHGVCWIKEEIRVQVGLIVAQEVNQYYRNTLANKKITDIKQQDIIETLKKLKSTPTKKNKGTISLYVSIALHELYKFLAHSKEHRHVLASEDFEWETKNLDDKFSYTKDNEIDYYSEDELKKLLLFVSSDYFLKLTNCEKICFYGFLILGQTGMRIGELLALKKSDIKNLKIVAGTKSLFVCKTVATQKVINEDGRVIDKCYIKDGTKTGNTRYITLIDSTHKMLEIVAEISEEMAPKGEFLFPVVRKRKVSDKKFMDRGTFVVMLKEAFKNTGVRLLNTHEGGRKTFTNQFIDLALKAGLDYYQSIVTASKTLGHRSPKTTEASYAQAKLLPMDKQLSILGQIAGDKKPA